MCPWADHLYACDGNWWKNHYESVKKTFKGQIWTQDAGWKDQVSWIESKSGNGLSKDVLIQGQNSGYQAINLAYILGAERVLLLGYDMTGIGSHWFGQHNGSGLSTNTNYEKYIELYDRMNPEAYGLEVINCSRKTALNCFSVLELEQALSLCG